MKKITNHKTKGARTVKNVCKKGFNNNKIIAYKRDSPVGNTEFAFLRRTSKDTVGFVSLYGGSNYSPVYIHGTYKAALAVAAKLRTLYIFKNLQDFIDNKHKMRTDG
jgi:hypothetical protein